ncbi:ATP-dependent DNA helicase [Pelomyxa schiedti]|nr:ATP-dependent DNA helicase [Pelomyxa schiedti]
MCARKSFRDAITAVVLLLQQKVHDAFWLMIQYTHWTLLQLLFVKSDELGVALFGTKETDNVLAGEGQYQHITVISELMGPTLSLLKRISTLTTDIGGFIDALVVGMDMIARKTMKKKYKKRIFLITDGGCPVLQDNLDVILERLNSMEIRLNIIGIDFDEDVDHPSQREISEDKRANEILLHEIAQKVNGAVFPVTEALELMAQLRSRGVLQRSTFRGNMEISSLLNIPVWTFVKTTKQAFPTLTKVSSVAMSAAKPSGMAVRQERIIQSIQDPDTEVSNEEVVKGYKYGKTLVPFSKIDEEALRLKPEDRRICVIGFADRESVPRFHYCSSTEILVAWPDDNNSAVALSALIHALEETAKVAIVRYVKTKRSFPKLACCIPKIKHDVEYFYVQYLPFAESLRQHQFPPLSPSNPSTRKTILPSQIHLKAAASLIHSLDLMSVEQEGEAREALQLKQTFNPVLQRFYQTVQQRALTPTLPLPNLDPSVMMTPLKSLFDAAEPAIAEFEQSFPLKKSEAAVKSEQKQFWRNTLNDASLDIKLDSYTNKGSDTDNSAADGRRNLYGNLNGGAMSLEKLVSAPVGSVGSVNPARDFMQMLKRRDDDFVETAITQLKGRITQLVEESIRDTYYAKALSCVVALRQGCVMEDEPLAYNSFLKELRRRYEGKTRDGFWKLIVENTALTLICDEESADSSISLTEASTFFEAPQVDRTLSTIPLPHAAPDEPGADQLLDMIE